ncbi:MAG: glycosyltransferase family 1 protein [Gemmatimonadales bacterium]|nr:MAG: glycosyltransferase family 1 protein [Gemmatimonadales bacterium]
MRSPIPSPPVRTTDQGILRLPALHPTWLSSMSRNQLPGASTVALMNETVGIGGAETVILQLAQELVGRGRRVVCVLPRKDDWLTAELEACGIPIRRFTIRGRMDLECVQEITEALRRDGVEAVHSHEFAMAVHGTAVAHRLGCPHVITMHGNQTVLDRLRRRVALRWAFRHSRAAVAVSVSTRDHMAERLGLSAEAIRVVRNGIPVRAGNRESTRRSLGLSPDHLAIFGAGSLVERKGFHVLVEALGMVERRGSVPAEWRLFIAGEGSYRPEIEAAIAREGLGDRVTLLGYRLDIPDLQAAADLFAMPSLWEGLPLAVLEGMFAGNPLVATRTSGIPEAVRDGVEGLLVTPGDPEELASALERLLSDADLRARLGAGARARATSEFTIQRMADEYEGLYGWA